MNIECYTGGAFQTNGYLLQGPQGNVLVDAPEGVADWLEHKGVAINELLLTHQHYDHVVDAAALKRQQPSCQLRCHSAYDADLTLESYLGRAIASIAAIESFEVDECLEGMTAIECCGLPFEIRHVPGHSPDSLCFYLPANDDLNQSQPILLGGDVLFQGGIGRTDFPHGNTELLLSGIHEKVLTLPGNTIVYPGHGPATTVEDEEQMNPFLNGLV